MARIKLQRLSSATLVETIVALTIIVTLFGITVTILTQTSAVAFSTTKIKAEFLLDQFVTETEQEKTFFDDIKEEGLFTLQKKLIETRAEKNIVILKFSALDINNKNIYYQNRIFRLK